MTLVAHCCGVWGQTLESFKRELLEHSAKACSPGAQSTRSPESPGCSLVNDEGVDHDLYILCDLGLWSDTSWVMWGLCVTPESLDLSVPHQNFKKRPLGKVLKMWTFFVYKIGYIQYLFFFPGDAEKVVYFSRVSRMLRKFFLNKKRGVICVPAQLIPLLLGHLKTRYVSLWLNTLGWLQPWERRFYSCNK